MLCVFGTVVFLLEGSIKRSKANLQIPGKRKNVFREIKNGNANNVGNMLFLLKSQNTKVTNTKLKISYSKHNVAYRHPYFFLQYTHFIDC